VAENVLDLVDRIFAGEVRIDDHNPVAAPRMELAEIADRTAFVNSFANVSAFSTESGLVLVDTGSPFTARSSFDQVRSWCTDPLHTAVYSHGHIDHVFGVPVYEEEAAVNGWAAPRVVAHEALPPRFDRYILTAGFNGAINRRQFGAANLDWPTEYRYPDQTYVDVLTLDVGGETFELHHARGETDDHTWTWVPGRRTLCTGDLIIWCTPNAGNPQKVQRYAREWSGALRDMVALGAEVLLPGHGLPIVGADRIATVLTDTADLLDSLHDQTLALMNEGAALDDILHTVTPPADLIEKPWLRPVYDDPEFIVRNVWRLYGGWYDGDPAHLKPAPTAELAGELADLAGGADRLAARASDLAGEGRLRLAGHLAELAARAAPDDPGVHRIRAEVNEARVADEPSLMAKGVFGAAARESRARAAD
jgi:alkyl sulfatase BDS1-like metallo-beta-lactamase superfamily hydrolase